VAVWFNEQTCRFEFRKDNGLVVVLRIEEATRLVNDVVNEARRVYHTRPDFEDRMTELVLWDREG
jgi:hypothetical protein